MQRRVAEYLRYFAALRAVGAANLSVEEAQAPETKIGRRCMKLRKEADVPEVAKVMASRLLAGWIERNAEEKRGREQLAGVGEAQV